jgi:glycosyltransferase involved in cell wall biosynthesis
VKVLHVVASGKRRGAEVFASDLVRTLRDAGMDQRVAVLRGEGSPAVAYEAPVSVLATRGSSRPVAGIKIRSLRGLRRLVDRWGPDVIQAHGGEPLKYAIPAALGRRRPPVVYRRIGSAPEEIARGARRLLWGGLMRRAARVIAVAEILNREMVGTFGVPPERVVTIPNGVDPARLEPILGREASRDRLGCEEHTPIVLSLGALVWEKDPLGQVEIAAGLARRGARFVMLLAGDGPLRAEVQAGIAREGLEDRVRLLGVREDVADLLAASDVLVLASRSEGMAATVIEAGRAGLPVVAYGVGGVPEVVQDGMTGAVVAAGDVEAMVERLERLLQDADERSRMGAAARSFCERFDIDRVGALYRAVYEELVRG